MIKGRRETFHLELSQNGGIVQVERLEMRGDFVAIVEPGLFFRVQVDLGSLGA